ncbi:MAG: GWxTD domain-containing protein [Acidobacteria bacterium]|uniref:GWxTD domain-containing protein n=1 Tax=Candidatus Polarisedimenticola svalbardensis TaxID=2886004 RepID=A0A8J7CMB6_9BACT|nr:GWxTD domain-containing protein [Candidatus Polarisedimenticola svalbardensis]
MTISRTAAVVLLAASVLLPAVYGNEKELDDWILGPIRYIVQPAERKAFRKLTGDGERVLFIERFWIRRDPTPDTMVNEYRQLFWERVREANEIIQDSPKPGWITDRGKIYILYGAPTEIKDYVDLAPESSPTSGRGVIRWIYEGSPANRKDLDPIVVVPFVRDYSGEYHLSYDPKLSSVYFNEYSIRTGERQRWDRYFERIGGSSVDSTLSVMLDLGRMQDVPQQEQILISRVLDRESFESHPLEVQVNRMRRPESQTVLTSITVRLPEAVTDQPPALMARLAPDGDTARVLILGEDSFRIREDSDGGLVAQARIGLEPGRWDLVLVAADPSTLSTGIHKDTVVIRKPETRPALSDVVIASRLEPVEVPALVSHEEPFVYGPFRAVPLAGRSLYPGDSLNLVYEIYHAEPPYTITYQLQGEEEDGRWTNLGRPATKNDAGQPVQAWELLLGAHWPAGTYRVVLNVRDASGQDLSETVGFTLEAPAVEPEP